jgi:hypothetical protein
MKSSRLSLAVPVLAFLGGEPLMLLRGLAFQPGSL